MQQLLDKSDGHHGGISVSHLAGGVASSARSMQQQSKCTNENSLPSYATAFNATNLPASNNT